MRTTKETKKKKRKTNRQIDEQMDKRTDGQKNRRTDGQTVRKKIEREKEKDSNAESGTAGFGFESFLGKKTNKPKKQTNVKYYICYHRQFYQLEAANRFILN